MNTSAPLFAEILAYLTVIKTTPGHGVKARDIAAALEKPFEEVRDALRALSEETPPRVMRSTPVLGGPTATYWLTPAVAPTEEPAMWKPTKVAMWKPTKVEELEDATAAVLLALNKEDHLPAAEMDRDAVWWLALRSLVNIKGGDVEITGSGLELVEQLLSVEVVA